MFKNKKILFGVLASALFLFLFVFFNKKNMKIDEKEIEGKLSTKVISDNDKAADQESDKIKKPFSESFDEVIGAIQSFKKGADVSEMYKFLKNIGAYPGIVIENELGELSVSGTKSVGDMRYFQVKYDFEKRPSWFRFEIEPNTQSYDEVLAMLKKEYPGLEEPCFQDSDHEVYESDEFLISLNKVNEEDVEEGDPWKPRSKEDIGAVEIVLEYDLHPGSCGGE